MKVIATVWIEFPEDAEGDPPLEEVFDLYDIARNIERLLRSPIGTGYHGLDYCTVKVDCDV